MATINLAQTLIALDLDDTLYKEIDYLKSGLAHVADSIKKIYGRDVANTMYELYEKNTPDLFGSLCLRESLPSSLKDSLLWIYRLHSPKIRLSEDALEFLQNAESRAKIVILTDGRSVTQRLKIMALGLGHLPVYISEEYESEKPSPLRFESIMKQYPNLNYVYIGDNLSKDFIAPNNLGWFTIGLRDDGLNIHAQNIALCDPNQSPKLWVSKFKEIIDVYAN